MSYNLKTTHPNFDFDIQNITEVLQNITFKMYVVF